MSNQNCPACGKVAHPTRSEAQRHMKSLRQRKGYSGHVYWCGRCSAWHVGRQHLSDQRNQRA